nr:glutaminase kidney isoform, mitochondrial isoform X2 [Caretta caretta]
MRLWSSALFRELLRLSQPGGAGGSAIRRPPAPFAAAAWGAGSLPSPGRLLPPPPPARSVCTRSEGALQEPGKGPPLSARAPPADTGNNNNHNGGQELAGGGGDNKMKQGLLPSLEDLLFYTIAEGQEKIPVHKFITALKSTGLRTSDPRLKECMDMLRLTLQTTSDGVMLDKDLFKKHSVGDTKVPFCLQSCVKPLKYAVAVNDLGTEYVHRYVGKEPSGLRFNKLFLNEDDRPHNPMVNAGAIVITSLIKQGANNAEKFDYMMQFMNNMAGNEYVGFNNATFQSERESGDRNFAIGYYLKEKKCFPEGTDMVAVLDFYFQLCSIEVTCESASVMAATLANGGFCPITGERVLSPESVRNTLSLMHSCGMYDFSGQFAFHVGLPAKSGVAGGILLVVPNVMGLMCWSPPLDKMGNSVKGIHFCHDLVSLCNFHNYDNLRHFAKKLDPRREGGDQRVKSVINLLFAAYTGDVSALRRFALSGMDMEQRDYDSRTALHVAAAEGHVEVIKFLLEACKVNPFPKDRWNNTPMDEALHFGHHDVFKILQEFQIQYTPPEDSSNGKENQTVHKNLDGLL